MGIFLQELSEVYQALTAGREPTLSALEYWLRDYATWQRDYMQGAVYESQLQYWQRVFIGLRDLELAHDKPRPKHIDYCGGDVPFTLEAGLSEQLRVLAKRQKTSLYTVLLSGFYLALSRLSGQADIVLGTPSDNRHHGQTHGLIGLFVNTLVLRTEVVLSSSVAGLIEQVHQVVVQGKAHQDIRLSAWWMLCRLSGMPHVIRCFR